MPGAFPPELSKRGVGGGAFFVNSIVGNFMVSQERLETKLVAHPKISELFSIASNYYFWVKFVVEHENAASLITRMDISQDQSCPFITCTFGKD